MNGIKNDEKVYEDIVTINIESAGTYSKDISLVAESGTEVTITALYTGSSKLNGNSTQKVKIDGGAKEVEYSIEYAGYEYSSSYLEVEKSVS